MKYIFTLLIIALTSLTSFSQKINGQWRGYFDSKGDIVLSGSNNTEYVLELEIDGTEVSGFSYSYFQNRRFYVICKLEGTYYKDSKSIKVIETERIKGNTPPDFQDCFQIHFLSYKKEGNQEQLVGKWQTSPGQRSNCGDGNTTLIRRTLNKDLSTFKAPAKEAAKPALKPAVQNTDKKVLPPVNNTTATVIPTPKKSEQSNKKTSPSTKPPQPSNITKIESVINESPTATQHVPNKIEGISINPGISFEKRNTAVLKSIEIENETFSVTLYDNGEVDGDSVSVFYNGKLILSHQRLSEKPLTVVLDATTGKHVNELTMYAENLGEIAPNTALMVVKDGENRYEVRIASDLKNSGSIHFIHKPKTK